MLLNCVAYGCRKRNQKESKPGFFRFANNDPKSCDKNGSMLIKEKKENRKPWNPSGENVYICGDHFVTGTFSVEFS